MTGSASPIWNAYANDDQLLELYRRRCRRQAEEMTCAAQVAEILAPRVTRGETLLDCGCGGGYYYWSFLNREIPIDYYGIDHTPQMIELARSEMCSRANLSEDRFILGSIENLDREFDHVICFNTLTSNAHYALPLERLLYCARKTIVIRESMGDRLTMTYTPDRYLNKDKRHIRVYHNTYPLEEVISFMKESNFKVTRIKDERSQDGTEIVCDVPHQWRILLGERDGRPS